MASRNNRTTPRRRFIKTAMALAAGTAPAIAQAQPAGAIAGFDHVALPMLNTDAMVAFYRALGVSMNETPNVISMYFGQQMINFHRPTLWQNAAFTLRAPGAKPPCGDLCFVWGGTPAALNATLARASAKVETGPVDRQGGRQRTGSSTYVRDPDGNLLEFIIYPT
jgi:catechol 2,3-dioxygenase-like lactoylglutathione lyase family enzyme